VGSLEEERRLMYVALTRARKTIRLSGCERRMVQGMEKDQDTSRFLGEIPPDCLDDQTPASRSWHSFAPEPHLDFDDVHDVSDLPELRPNMQVVHPEFGAGVIRRVSGSGIQARVVVRFEDEGERTLLLEYANLEVVPQGDDW